MTPARLFNCGANMSELTLEDYSRMADGETVTLTRAPRESFELTPGQAYPIEITLSEPCVSKNGFTQVCLHLSIVQHDGELKACGRHWESMPIDLPADMDEERAIMMKGIFGRNMHALLRAIDPVTFSIYAKKEGTGRNARYLDADGNELNPVERKQRTQAIERAIIGACKAIQDGQLDLSGRRLFVVKVAHSNGNTYTQYYSDAPDKFPLADA